MYNILVFFPVWDIATVHVHILYSIKSIADDKSFKQQIDLNNNEAVCVRWRQTISMTA